MWTDTTRAALMVFLQNAVSFLVLVNILAWNGTQVAGADVLISSGVVLLFLLFKRGQAPDPNLLKMKLKDARGGGSGVQPTHRVRAPKK